MDLGALEVQWGLVDREHLALLLLIYLKDMPNTHTQGGEWLVTLGVVIASQNRNQDRTLQGIHFHRLVLLKWFQTIHFILFLKNTARENGSQDGGYHNTFITT